MCVKRDLNLGISDAHFQFIEDKFKYPSGLVVYSLLSGIYINNPKNIYLQ